MHPHRDLYENVVLSGGSTLFPGLSERLSTELTALAPSAMKVKVIASPERKNLAWIGGSIVGSNPRSAIFQSTCISKEMYDEAGPEVVHSKV